MKKEVYGWQGKILRVNLTTREIREEVLSEELRRGYIGVSGQTAPVPRRHALNAGIDNASGAMISALEPDGPAARAGLMSLDTIVRVDGHGVTGVDDLIRLLNHERIGRDLDIEALRRGTLRVFTVRPQERPAPKKAA